jgi:hypothetical protein
MLTQLRKFIWTLAIIVPAVAPGQAIAEAFSFNVPIDLKDIHPKYTRVRVVCKVIAANGVDLVGSFGSFVLLQNHGFNGILSVPVDPVAGKSALDGTSYFCDAFYCATPDDATCVNAASTAAPENKVQPGTPFIPGVKGPIP